MRGEAWSWAISNADDSNLTLHLSPWSLEFDLPSRSTIVLTFGSFKGQLNSVEAEQQGTDVLVSVTAGDLAHVAINDGINQHALDALSSPRARFGRNAGGLQYLLKQEALTLTQPNARLITEPRKALTRLGQFLFS